MTPSRRLRVLNFGMRWLVIIYSVVIPLELLWFLGACYSSFFGVCRSSREAGGTTSSVFFSARSNGEGGGALSQEKWSKMHI